MTPLLQPKKLRVLFIASEADPLIKVGGLADVTGSLPKALLELPPEQTGGWQLNVDLAIPFHAALRAKIRRPEPLLTFNLRRSGEYIGGQIYRTTLEATSVAQGSRASPQHTAQARLPVYLVDGPPFQQGPPAIYTGDPRVDGERYTFFSLAALALARQLDPVPNILHANDWHTALALYELAQQRLQEAAFVNTRGLLTLHNLPFMGAGSEPALEAYGVPASQDSRLPSWARQIPLPLGLLAADFIVAVSPTYAKEILTPPFGCDLQDFLLTRAASLTGILNGLDTNRWNPATDSAIPNRFDVTHLERRKLNKQALQQETSLASDPDRPLIISVGRLDQQKGIDLLLQVLRQSVDLPWQAILLGTGDPGLEMGCRQLAEDFPERVRAFVRFDAELSRRLYAAADLLVMPSRYEPCGLAQMIAMRYGCLPLAHATGGLRDTILDDPERGTGFLFHRAEVNSLESALRRALQVYQDQATWQAMQQRAMQQDFSWQRSALEYVRLYRNLIGDVQPP